MEEYSNDAEEIAGAGAQAARAEEQSRAEAAAGQKPAAPYNFGWEMSDEDARLAAQAIDNGEISDRGLSDLRPRSANMQQQWAPNTGANGDWANENGGRDMGKTPWGGRALYFGNAGGLAQAQANVQTFKSASAPTAQDKSLVDHMRDVSENYNRRVKRNQDANDLVVASGAAALFNEGYGLPDGETHKALDADNIAMINSGLRDSNADWRVESMIMRRGPDGQVRFVINTVNKDGRHTHTRTARDMYDTYLKAIGGDNRTKDEAQSAKLGKDVFVDEISPNVSKTIDAWGDLKGEKDAWERRHADEIAKRENEAKRIEIAKKTALAQIYSTFKGASSDPNRTVSQILANGKENAGILAGYGVFVQGTDKDGKPLFDPDGKPVYVSNPDKEAMRAGVRSMIEDLSSGKGAPTGLQDELDGIRAEILGTSAGGQSTAAAQPVQAQVQPSAPSASPDAAPAQAREATPDQMAKVRELLKAKASSGEAEAPVAAPAQQAQSAPAASATPAPAQQSAPSAASEEFIRPPMERMGVDARPEQTAPAQPASVAPAQDGEFAKADTQYRIAEPTDDEWNAAATDLGMQSFRMENGNVVGAAAALRTEDELDRVKERIMDRVVSRRRQKLVLAKGRDYADRLDAKYYPGRYNVPQSAEEAALARRNAQDVSDANVRQAVAEKEAQMTASDDAKFRQVNEEADAEDRYAAQKKAQADELDRGRFETALARVEAEKIAEDQRVRNEQRRKAEADEKARRKRSAELKREKKYASKRASENIRSGRQGGGYIQTM